MRRAVLGTVMVLLAASAARADLFTKTYAFKPDTVLEVGAEVADGITIDSIRFVFPASQDGSPVGAPKAEVTISNLGKSSRKIGLAVAVLDGEARLLGVASGGTKMFPLRAERQMKYVLTFDDVHSELDRASVFKLSVESR